MGEFSQKTSFDFYVNLKWYNGQINLQPQSFLLEKGSVICKAFILLSLE